mmetsp:Transcript_47914/g.70909  ORF Transcript_47914/g.70909 Transcript_47914/m.70909 type:complete len:105 (+) Transcript_47914:2727-3041(+)
MFADKSAEAAASVGTAFGVERTSPLLADLVCGVEVDCTTESLVGAAWDTLLGAAAGDFEPFLRFLESAENASSSSEEDEDGEGGRCLRITFNGYLNADVPGCSL